MTSTVPASMGGPLSEAELERYGDLIDTVPGPGPALSWTAEARLLAEAQRARARVGVLEGQLATAREIHKPFEYRGDRFCCDCSDLGGDGSRGGIEWPCDTAQALGLDGGGTDA